MTNRIGPMDQGSIGKLGNKVEDTATTRLTGGNQGAKSQPGNTSSFGDTVNLTSGGQLLSRLQESLSTAPSVDVAKVADVKAAIASGNYEIDSGAIADAMIRFEQSLGE